MATNAEQIVNQAPVEIDEEVAAQQYVDKILAEEAATTRPRDETGKFVSTKEESETVPAEAEAEEDASPETVTGDETEAEDNPETPVIAPPDSWPADDKAAWDGIPSNLQAVIAKRDAEQKAAFNRQINEASESRKKYDSEMQGLNQERQRYADSLKIVTNYVQMGLDPILAEWARADRAKLAQEDPAGYLALQARVQERQEQLGAIYAEQQRLTEHQTKEQRDAHNKRLAEVFPDFADPVKGKAIVDKWAPVLLSNGFSQDEINQTRDVPWDPRHLKLFDLLVDKAAKYDKAEAARKTIVEKKVAQQAPKIAKTKAQDDGQKGKSPRVAALEQRAKESGSLQDKADYFSELLAEE